MEYKILEAEYVQKNDTIQINPKSIHIILHSELFPEATNNIGEFLAIVDAMKYNYEHNYSYTIFSDSQTAIQRVQSKKIKTKLKHNKDTIKILTKLKEAVVRLKKHQVPYTIQKRKTKISGEIPADF
ncbi:MAG: hypothetical protein NZM44_01590 [Candidatus Calescibacterium sp.]|nr:hypothetical protein [Candidatus Calescibacterium sp.]